MQKYLVPLVVLAIAICGFGDPPVKYCCHNQYDEYEDFTLKNCTEPNTIMLLKCRKLTWIPYYDNETIDHVVVDNQTMLQFTLPTNATFQVPPDR